MTTNIITAVVTAYCSCTEICCPKSSKGLTADGHKPKEGYTVAASRNLPFGTICIISGHAYVVQDRLAKKYDSRFDVYFSSHAKAKNFGVKTQQVTIIRSK